MSETKSFDVKAESQAHSRRFHLPHAHLEAPFGGDWFGKHAEGFARFFGTPKFLIIQTVIVAIWIWANVVGWAAFDIYPFILLNLAFSLQAAYAAPLILLAQTRQADRDKANSMADAEHREELHKVAERRQSEMERQSALLVKMLEQNTSLTGGLESLLKQNTDLTQTVKTLVERIETLTIDVHQRVSSSAA